MIMRIVLVLLKNLIGNASLQLARAERVPVIGCCSQPLVLLDRTLNGFLLVCRNGAYALLNGADRPATAHEKGFYIKWSCISHLVFDCFFRLFLHRFHGCEIGKYGTRDMCWRGSR